MKLIAGLLLLLASGSPGFAEPHPIEEDAKGSVGLMIRFSQEQLWRDWCFPPACIDTI